MACKDSNENEELRDCTPECVKYFTDFGGDCELLEDAAKLQVVRAFNMGKLTSDETKALFAWYVLSSTDVCPHAPTLSLYRSIALSLTRSLASSGTISTKRRTSTVGIDVERHAAVRRDTLSLTRAARFALQKLRMPPRATLSSTSRSTKTKPKGMAPSSWRR